MTRSPNGATVLLSAVLLTALAVAPFAQAPPAPGDPLRGLTPVEFELFSIGLEDFLEVEDAEEGLGPAYNGTSCGGCHNVPAVGGTSPVAELRAGVVDANQSYSDFDPDAGSLFQLFSIPTHGCQVVIPTAANVIARRVPIPVFGGGLVEAIPDDTLLALADPLDLDRDGVSGRAAVVEDVATGDLRVGRFGWKSQQATLIAFGADAYLNEMGITSDLFPNEQSFGISAELMRLCDPIPDPEDIPDPATGRRGIDNFEAFMQFLAPIGRGPDRRPGPGGRSDVRRHRLRRLSCAVARDRTEHEPAVRPQDGAVVLRPGVGGPRLRVDRLEAADPLRPADRAVVRQPGLHQTGRGVRVARPSLRAERRPSRHAGAGVHRDRPEPSRHFRSTTPRTRS